MADDRRCPECGALLLDDADGGAGCPRCLMRLAVDPALEHADKRSGGSSGPAGPATAIGPYTILRSLGEGGMGEVFLAEQREPIRRQVALKVIKRGMDTKRVVARFEAERQALALMDHPAIARVFEAGETADGRPYFVMEYVDGEPITEHCDRHRLSIDARLDLMKKVCAGVQHAHQKGVIHRDLKPSNVLVTEQDGDAVPKIIDFGVAKAVSQRLTEETLFTELGVMIGTPEYMSPEQADMSALDVDTRSDVYSLGVILYELLTGYLPFDRETLMRAGIEEIRRRIRDDEPSTPSTRLSTLGDRATDAARRRQTDPVSLRRELRGDLDWIVMKALEKDPTRRYQGSAELAADIERHLRNEPVVARAPSAGYRLSKFVRRHTLGVSLGALAALFLIVFAVAMAVLAARIADERDRANRERVVADRVSTFMTDMLAGIDPRAMGETMVDELEAGIDRAGREGRLPATEIEALKARLREATARVNTTEAARRMLDASFLSSAGESLREGLEADAEIAARLLQTLAEAYRGLGMYDEAMPFAQEAVDLFEEALGADAPSTLKARHTLASVKDDAGEWEEAEAIYRDVVARLTSALGRRHPDTLRVLNGLGVALSRQKRLDEAELILREVVEGRQKVLGPDDPGTLTSRGNYAVLLQRMKKLEEAEEQLRELAARREAIDGEHHPATLVAVSNLAVVLYGQERYEDAEPFYRQALEGWRVAVGSDHPNALTATNNMAMLMEKLGRHEEAEAYYRDTESRFRAALGDDHPNTLISSTNLAIFLSHVGRLEEAEAGLREALPRYARTFGDDHARTERVRKALADVVRKRENGAGPRQAP